MKRNLPVLFVFSVTAGLVLSPVRAQTPDSCSKLADLKIPGISLEITKASNVPPAPLPKGPLGNHYEGTIPAHCRVDGVIEPRKGVNNVSYGIGFALALPENWNGRFLFQGGGGLNGTVQASG